MKVEKRMRFQSIVKVGFFRQQERSQHTPQLGKSLVVPYIIGFLRGGGNWGTLKIPREDWGTLGNIKGRLGESPPPLKNPIIIP